MSKISNVRLPNTTTQQYSPQQFDQLVRSLEQVIFQLNNTYTPIVSEQTATTQNWMSAQAGAGSFSGGIRSFQLSNGIALPYAMLLSDQDQASAGVTSENLLTYNQVALTNGIKVVNNSQIHVPCAGQYLVTFTLQVSNRGTGLQEFEVWAKDTGTNYPLSATRFDISARKSASIWSHIVPAVTGIFTVTDPAINYFEIAWWASSTNVFIQYYGENTSPTRPAIPSVILTINFVSAI